MRTHDRFGVFPNVDEGGAEARLLVQLIVVQSDERTAEDDRCQRTAGRIQNRQDEQQGTDGPQHPGKRHDRETAVEQHQDERERGDREPSNVLGDPLVRVREFARGVQAVVGSTGEIELDGSLSQGFPPKQAKAFLREARYDSNHRGSREHADVENRLVNEFGLVAIGDRSHEVSADVTVENVQAVCPE